MPRETTPSDQPAQTRLSEVRLFILAAASAVVTANAYYIHPIIAYAARDFGVGASMIGLVPALNQIALAIGIVLFLPLGDRIGNRTLTSIFVAGQTAALVVMALSEAFWPFVAGSALLGAFTIAPYLLPAYVSKRVDPASLGRAMSLLTTGIIAGILLARVGAGVVGEYLGWRTIYWIAAALMLAVSIGLPMTMENRAQPAPRGERSYLRLLSSIPAIVRTYPEVLTAGAIQALNFGIFLSVWLGLGLHLTSPAMGYGADTVGYLAAFALVNLFATPRLGVWADKVGPRRARMIISFLQWPGVILLLFTGHSLWLLMLPILMMNVAGPVIDVTNRMTFLKEDPAIRTRLMTVYIMMMFMGAGVASWAGTAAYDLAAWRGTAMLAAGMGTLVLVLASWSERRRGGDAELPEEPAA